MNRGRVLPGARRGARGAVILFWVLVVAMLGARIALFDEIRAVPSSATMSDRGGGHG